MEDHVIWFGHIMIMITVLIAQRIPKWASTQIGGPRIYEDYKLQYIFVVHAVLVLEEFNDN